MDPADALIETIRRSVIGDDEAVAGPFGIRRVTYADYTASGRSLTFLEDYLRDAVLPLYANTHTESSGTGLQTSRFRAEARELIRRAVGATDEHAVIFVGSGSTGAINRLVDVLQIRLPGDLSDRYGLCAAIPPAERPVVSGWPRDGSADVEWGRERRRRGCRVGPRAPRASRRSAVPIRFGSEERGITTNVGFGCDSQRAAGDSDRANRYRGTPGAGSARFGVVRLGSGPGWAGRGRVSKSTLGTRAADARRRPFEWRSGGLIRAVDARPRWPGRGR
jgi:hypothetical protein